MASSIVAWELARSSGASSVSGLSIARRHLQAGGKHPGGNDGSYRPSWYVSTSCSKVIILLIDLDGPDRAGFLNYDEKKSIQKRLEADEATAESDIWLLVLLTLCITIPSGVITTFSAVLIHSFGFDSKQSALLNMPSGVVSIFATILSTWAIVKQAPRWLSVIGLLIPALIGGALLSFEGIGRPARSLAGIYLVNFRVAASAVVSAAFGIANIISPQTYQAKDAPEYLLAKITLMVVIASALPITLALRVLYGHRNRTRGTGGLEYRL
ncbi:hypothetical protein D6D00_10369 [Aureobasidium pullulans]|nr:hypothetical protein D6D00_10369 [Aureobasidium pullulans]